MNNVLARFLKGPFKADFRGGIVWTADQFHFADVRGWGQLGYKGDGEKVQDFHLQFMVDALNEKLAREEIAEGKGPKASAPFWVNSPTKEHRNFEVVGHRDGPVVGRFPFNEGDEHTKALASNYADLMVTALTEVEEMKRELDWLRFYKTQVYGCLGPASGDIYKSIRDQYVATHPELPKKLREEIEDEIANSKEA